jgi:hypothetical protein
MSAAPCRGGNSLSAHSTKRVKAEAASSGAAEKEGPPGADDPSRMTTRFKAMAALIDPNPNNASLATQRTEEGARRCEKDPCAGAADRTVHGRAGRSAREGA